MAKRKSKAGSPLSQTKTVNKDRQDLIQQFSNLQDRGDNIFAGYRFICEAVLAMTDPDRTDIYEDWHFGFFLHQQWASQQAEGLMEQMQTMKEALKKHSI